MFEYGAVFRGDAASVSKARDSYRVRQVGHQLPETEVRTIWLFETTPGVSRSKFPVLQHRSGRQAAALQSESQPQKRPLLISFFSAVLWEKNHSKSLTHLCLLLGASQGSSQPGWGPLLWGGQSRTGTFTAGCACSCLSVTAATWPLLMNLATRVRIHGSLEALLAARPTAPGISTHPHPCLSVPLHPELSISQGRGSQGWADCWWSAKRCKEMTVTPNLLSRRAVSSHSGQLGCSFKQPVAWYMQKILLHSPSVCCWNWRSFSCGCTAPNFLMYTWEYYYLYSKGRINHNAKIQPKSYIIIRKQSPTTVVLTVLKTSEDLMEALARDNVQGNCSQEASQLSNVLSQ